MCTNTSSFQGTLDTTDGVLRARRGLAIYGLVLVPLTLFGYWFYTVGEANGLLLGTSLPLMLAPAIASVVTRCVLHEGFADLSFAYRGRYTSHALALGVAVPLVIGSVAYSLAIVGDLVQFAPPLIPLLPASADPIVHFIVLMVMVATLGTLVLLPTASGEEIGWRGYVVPRLIEARVPQPILVSGVIWGAWHLVPVFTAGYAAGPYPVLSAVNLMIAIPAFGALLAWMRLDTGSILPCIVAHAAWNAIINGGFDLAVRGEAVRIWIGESGILVVLVLLLMTLIIGHARRSWNIYK